MRTPQGEKPCEAHSRAHTQKNLKVPLYYECSTSDSTKYELLLRHLVPLFHRLRCINQIMCADGLPRLFRVGFKEPEERKLSAAPSRQSFIATSESGEAKLFNYALVLDKKKVLMPPWQYLTVIRPNYAAQFTYEPSCYPTGAAFKYRLQRMERERDRDQSFCWIPASSTGAALSCTPASITAATAASANTRGICTAGAVWLGSHNSLQWRHCHNNMQKEKNMPLQVWKWRQLLLDPASKKVCNKNFHFQWLQK